MSDEAGFLRAIAANLHDDLPRLAYADWLDDRSDPRGEYLRLQVELARTWTYLDQKPHLYARLAELTPALDPGWLAAVRRCTTPAPPVDVAKLFPELAPLAKTAVRLHPRPGEAPVDASKLGGPILWPQREPWPDCPEHGTPLVPVVQLRKADVPEVGFPLGADLFQLLWCPRTHDSTIGAPLPFTRWRNSAAVKRARTRMPVLRQERGVYGHPTTLRPCRLHPERVVEFPDPFEFESRWYFSEFETSEGLRETVEGIRSMPRKQDWNIPSSPDSLYQGWVSCADGSKVGGHPDWVQDPWRPVCSCGAAMEHLFQYGSGEYDGLTWGRWVPVEDRPYLERDWHLQREISEPANCMIGDCGNVYVFVCRRCPGWPVRGQMQCS